MRKYKIIEEKRPTDGFTRWIPMVTSPKKNGGRIVENWEKLKTYVNFSNKGYFEKKERAEEFINRYEVHMQEIEVAFIVDETEYTPTSAQNYLDEQEGIRELARLKKEYAISPEELEIFKNQSKHD
jgi:hypothetical protein